MLWFRCDYRLEDNLALKTSIGFGSQTVPFNMFGSVYLGWQFAYNLVVDLNMNDVKKF